MSEKPSPQQAKNRLQKAIQKNEPLDWLLYETLCDAKVTRGPITIQIWPELNENLQEYKEAWLLLTSPQGRKYIKKQLDTLLDYIQTLIEGS